MTARAGFTLVEMVTVIVVLGIVAAVAAPALRPDRRDSGAYAARALRAAYAEARSTAARRGVPVLVVVETATDSFALFAEREGAAPEPLRAGRLPLPAGATIVGGREGRATARFTPLGRARADAVTLVDGDQRYPVAVDAWTGDAPR